MAEDQRANKNWSYSEYVCFAWPYGLQIDKQEWLCLSTMQTVVILIVGVPFILGIQL